MPGLEAGYQEGMSFLQQTPSEDMLPAHSSQNLPVSIATPHFSIITGEINAALVIAAVVNAAAFGQLFEYFRFTKKPRYLICAICLAIIAIVFALWFVARVQGWGT